MPLVTGIPSLAAGGELGDKSAGIDPAAFLTRSCVCKFRKYAESVHCRQFFLCEMQTEVVSGDLHLYGDSIAAAVAVFIDKSGAFLLDVTARRADSNQYEK